jgi:hypothetical protein
MNTAATAGSTGLGLGLFFGPLVTAAIVAAVVSYIVARINRSALLKTNAEKIAADREASDRRISADIDMAVQRLSAEREKDLSQRAWVDYELRRDAYIDMAQQIDCLFSTGDRAKRPELHRTARRIRLVGSDEVVRAMNALFAAIKAGEEGSLEGLYRSFFNEMRRDIRRLHAMPPVGTDLSDDAFPIES